MYLNDICSNNVRSHGRTPEEAYNLIAAHCVLAIAQRPNPLVPRSDQPTDRSTIPVQQTSQSAKPTYLPTNQYQTVQPARPSLPSAPASNATAVVCNNDRRAVRVLIHTGTLLRAFFFFVSSPCAPQPLVASRVSSCCVCVCISSDDVVCVHH